MPKNINKDTSTIQLFSKIFLAFNEYKLSKITLNFKNTSFICGEMIVLLGALKEICDNTQVDMEISNLDNVVNRVLSSHKIFNTCVASKDIETAIHYKCFINDLNDKQNEIFDFYTKSELKQNLNLKKEEIDYILRYLSELFINARTHANTNMVFCCGQRYPNLERVRFSILDLGVSIPYVVERYNNNYYKNNDADAISWAVKKGNSTKDNPFGGLGLHDIEEFIKENAGSLTIISRYGYYVNSGGVISKKNMFLPFRGTMVIIDICDNTYNINNVKKFRTNLKTFALEI